MHGDPAMATQEKELTSLRLGHQGDSQFGDELPVAGCEVLWRSDDALQLWWPVVADERGDILLLEVPIATATFVVGRGWQPEDMSFGRQQLCCFRTAFEDQRELENLVCGFRRAESYRLVSPSPQKYAPHVARSRILVVDVQQRPARS